MTEGVRPWSGPPAQKALDQVRRHGEANDLPCCICKLPIDYSLRKPAKSACTVQHIKSRDAYPHLTWEPSNWAPAHADCNSSAGNREAVSLGVVSPW